MLGWLFWTKGQWFPWWLVFSCCLIPWLFDFSVAWNHGPIKAVETEKGYVRFISQSQQKGVSGCRTNNVKKGVWHFRGRLMLPVWPVWPAAPSQRYFPQVLAWLFWFESIKCQGILSQQLVVLTRQISAMLWDSVQASELPWDWITTGFSNLSLNPDSTISLCPWTNYILSLSLSILNLKGDKIIVKITGNNG